MYICYWPYPSCGAFAWSPRDHAIVASLMKVLTLTDSLWMVPGTCDE